MIPRRENAIQAADLNELLSSAAERLARASGDLTHQKATEKVAALAAEIRSLAQQAARATDRREVERVTQRCEFLVVELESMLTAP